MENSQETKKIKFSLLGKYCFLLHQLQNSWVSSLFLEIFFPKKCVVCGEYGKYLCFSCFGKIETMKSCVCPECGKLSEKCQICNRCKSKIGRDLDAIIVAAHYDSKEIKEVIHNLKYNGIKELTSVLGEILWQRINSVDLPRNLVICAVPLHLKREADRGFNQSEEMAKYLSMKTGLGLVKCLERTRETESQIGKNRKERISNMNGAFECFDKTAVFGKNILLIDDVVTSGATLSACGNVLKNAGVKKVFALVVARNR